MIEGKISNQAPRRKMGGHTCGNCCRIHPAPEITTIKGVEATFNIYHYMVNVETKNPNYDCYIYETKCGTAVTYCSDRCRRLHNHRFKKTIDKVNKAVQEVKADIREAMKSFIGEKIK